jgi:hypothetical protein
MPDGVDIRSIYVSGNSIYLAMHGVRKKLLDRQASELKLPLHVIELPSH